MPFSLDPVDYYRRMSGLGEKESPANTAPKFESKMARGYGKNFGAGQGVSQLFAGDQDDGMDTTGTSAVMGGLSANNEAEIDLGIGALGAIGDINAAEIQAEIAAANRKAQDKIAAANRGASRTNSIIGAVGGIGAAAVGALI